MTRTKAVVAGAVIAAFGVVYAWSQAGLGSRSLVGNEVVQVALGGPGGTSIFVPVAQLRGGSNPTTTATVTGTLSTLTNNTGLLISTAAATGAMVVNLPATPYDGQGFVWVNGTGSAFTTGNTVATTDGSTIQGANATGALAAGASIQFVYVLSTNTWYKVR